MIGSIFYKLNKELYKTNDNLVEKEKIIEDKNAILIQDSIVQAQQIDSIRKQNLQILKQKDSIINANILLSIEKRESSICQSKIDV